MKRYSFQAIDARGQAVDGQIEAPSVSKAVVELESRGLSLRSIQEVIKDDADAGQTQVDAHHSVLHSRIDACLENRSELISALNALVEDLPRSNVQSSLRRLATQLGEGCRAAQLLDDRQSAAWLPLLARPIGPEPPGVSPRACKQITDSLQAVLEESRLQRRRLQAWLYPVVLLVVASLVLGLLCILLVPQFRKMFFEFGLRLPMPTRLLIWISDQFTVYAWRNALLIGPVLVVLYPIVRWWRRSSLVYSLFGWVFAGSTKRVSAMASFTHLLAELLVLDASLPEALRIAGKCSNDSQFSKTSHSLAEHIEMAVKPLNQSSVAHCFPPTLIYALQAGTGGKPHIALLRELSLIYASRVRMRSEWESAVIGPMAVFLVGVMVFFVVVALFMPLVAMVSSLA